MIYDAVDISHKYLVLSKNGFLEVTMVAWKPLTNENDME